MHALTDNLIVRGIHDTRLKGLGIRLCLGIRAIQAVKLLALLREHILLTVVLHLTACPLHREAIFQRILGDRVVLGIVDLAVHNGLQAGILGRVNRKTAAVQEIMGLGIRIAELVLEVLLHLTHKLVGKVAVGVGRLLLGNQIGIFDAVVDIVR